MKCNYEPRNCLDHGAIAFAMFPANQYGFCDKNPSASKQFCADENEENVCSYCVFGSAENPEYVAAFPEQQMDCRMVCEPDGPMCKCMNKLLTTLLY